MAVEVEVAANVATVTLTEPAAWAGSYAVMDVSEFTKKNSAGTLPNETEVAPVKLVPLIVTSVPPSVLSPVTDRPVTVGDDALE